MKNRLVALGSAAVLAVYAAGYERTRAAAQKFAGDAGDRRPSPPSSETPFRAVSTAISPAAASLPRSVPPRLPAAAPSAAQSSAAVASLARDSAPPPVRTADSVAAALPVIKTDSTAAEKQQKQERVEKAAAQWKDGSYTGWGTSRHGDIQATVVIEDGHIIGASISQCLTRYSCSWISALPPQVISRQGANVDYVSGATQSTNAFYFAVLEALSKAK